jgi:hypothetical protein
MKIGGAIVPSPPIITFLGGLGESITAMGFTSLNDGFVCYSIGARRNSSEFFFGTEPSLIWAIVILFFGLSGASSSCGLLVFCRYFWGSFIFDWFSWSKSFGYLWVIDSRERFIPVI